MFARNKRKMTKKQTTELEAMKILTNLETRMVFYLKLDLENLYVVQINTSCECSGRTMNS